MDEVQARKELRDAVRLDNGLYCLGHYMAWTPEDKRITLDDEFTADELEAIVWWMRNKGRVK